MKIGNFARCTRRIAVSILGMALIFSMSGCGGSDPDKTGQVENKKKLFDEPVTFTIMVCEHPSQQVNPDGEKYKAIKEATNVTLDFEVVPSSVYKTKKRAAMAAGTICDIMYVEQSDLQEYAASGIFLKLDDYLESELPNFYSYVKNDETWARTKIDGSVYGLTILNAGIYPNGAKAPVIRYDILEKNNIAMPTTYDEWFVVMKRLKTIYPDSTPFSGRNAGINMLANMEYGMGTYVGFGYDPKIGQYQYGALTDDYLPILEFWIKCWNEGIIDHNWASVDSNTWDTGVNNNKIFFWYDNAGFASNQTSALQKNDPSALMQIMPLMANSNGERRGVVYPKHQYETYYALNASCTQKDKLLKFMDWCYSEEGMYICNYGKEGETFNKDSDGNVTIEPSIVEKYRSSSSPLYNWMSDYGLGLLSFSPLVRDNGELLTQLGQDNSQFMEILTADYEAGYYQPEFVDVTLPSEVNRTIQSKKSDVDAKIFSEVRKFIEGTRPITEWNQFVVELKNLGAEEVVAAYNEALNK